MIHPHLRMLVGQILGTAAGLAAAGVTLLGAQEPEELEMAATSGVVLGVGGYVLGSALPLRDRARGWIVAGGTIMVMGLEYLLVRGLLRRENWAGALAGKTWVLLIAGSLLAVPQIVLGLVELADRVRRPESHGGRRSRAPRGRAYRAQG